MISTVWLFLIVPMAMGFGMLLGLVLVARGRDDD